MMTSILKLIVSLKRILSPLHFEKYFNVQKKLTVKDSLAIQPNF